MCGIVGLCHLNGQPVNEVTLKRMTDAISHRGPDDEGQHVDGPVGLGNRRLAIIDLSPAGHMPMSDSAGQTWITYNGEMYNFLELRSELESQGHCFRSNTDTEVILAAYHTWGEACVDRFNGMFAFAIWDKLKQRVFLARDRYGIKPLYYYHQNNVFLFGSEIKSFLEYPDFSADVEPAALLEYFTFQNIFTDLTLFQNVKLLPPGHTATLSLKDKRFATYQYWDFNFQESEQVKDMAEYEEELDRLFSNAVKRQLISDVPVGSYLSGGMDSGAITAISSQNLSNLPTFTGGFDLSSASGLELGFDERERAEALSYRFKTEHYQVVMKAGDMERVFPNLIWHLEDLRVGQCYPNYYVSRLASKFVKVILSGTGGDELFAGYPWRYYRAVNNQNFEAYIQKYYLYWQRLVRNKVIHQLFQPFIWDQIENLLTVDIFKNVFGSHHLNTFHSPQEYVNHSLYFEMKTFLHGLLVVEDKLSMAHSLETRVPFLDNDLVDFAMRLPVHTKLRDLDHVTWLDENAPGTSRAKYLEKTNDGKIILRNVLGRYMPQEYVTGFKQGFSAPDASWFRGDSLDYVKKLILNDNALIYNFLQPDTVRMLVNEHLDGKMNRRLLIWSLLSFEWWLNIFIEGNRNLN